MTDPSPDDYGLSKIPDSQEMEAPQLDYLPPRPKQWKPKIGLIGAGGITEYHLKAYQRMGLEVTDICDMDPARAQDRQQQYYPAARVTDDYQKILENDAIDVVDIATHPEERVSIISESIDAGKHILSQKPFVTDLSMGHQLVEKAEKANVHLAVNQNGRWAPHFSYLSKAIQEGILGSLASIDFMIHWDHTWTAGSHFEQIHHLLLYDFAIHWFDITCAMVGKMQPKSIFASVCRTSFQSIKPPFLAHVVIDYENIQVRMCFNAHVTYGQEDRTVVAGSAGTARAWGPSLNDQTVELWTEKGNVRPKLQGNWFDSGFEGSMGELLCAIEQGRPAWNNAKDNLRSLELCFSALKSADSGKPARFD